jgi:hypothetical protein
MFFKYINKKSIYNAWINSIVKDAKKTTGIEGLLKHLIHHAQEGISEGVSSEWFASVENLLEIIKRFKLETNYAPIDLEMKLERLYLHWQSDPEHMIPPPQLDLFIEALHKAAEKRRLKIKWTGS